MFAQQADVIRGVVLQQETQEPIPGAQVFINGTTLGTLSDSLGNFILKDVPIGIVEVVVRVLGFEYVSFKVNTNSIETEYRVELREKVYELDQITVSPDPEEWKINFEQFRKVFIGQGPFSDETKIKNKEDLNFEYDVKQNKLIAFAYDKLIIENKALGYEIYFYLENFQIDFTNRTNTFSGQTQFIPLKSRRKRTQRRWEANRELAYKGSFLHFSQSLIANRSVDEGFVVKWEKREDKARYITRDTIATETYFQKVEQEEYLFRFDNFINVQFMGEFEDPSYLRSIASVFDSNPRTLVDYQVSSVTLLADSVRMDKNAYIYNPTDLLFDGYWSFESVSDMLPLDYSMLKKDD